MTVFQEVQTILDSFAGNVSAVCKNLETGEARTAIKNVHE